MKAMMRMVILGMVLVAGVWGEPVKHRTAKVEGLDIFYREAGPEAAPVLVLLHGFPSSSSMFRNVIPELARKYHVIAPDYPGFGQSSMPGVKEFDYSFDRLADVVEGLLEQKGVKKFAMYWMDYGAPVGQRLALRHPERVTGLIVQNGNSYEEGLSDFWKPLRALWAERSAATEAPLREFLKIGGTKWQYTNGVKEVERVSPDAWTLDQAGLDRPGNAEIQLALFHDYRNNLKNYAAVQKFLREKQPPVLVVWGANDVIFPAAGAKAYLKDVPKAELHLLDTGHFALETHGEEMARLMVSFLDRTQGGQK